ncbi:MAG: adenosylcobalamin-dependent ribonucleoside-diphosphate reductase [Candidatus Bathyarchaeota archaeon]|nr:adenosylcobalamin-dependent ribonucleoside-diphosphate reductase [Candidatus Bathyarchaeota archaeon]MDH5494086.1 adenosylcobalamin-dependent ribonucleoside-diphosphate reductase [Candidatus Bathyarchaeota archaeon]
MVTIEKIKKRDGRIAEFDSNKITEAIWKAEKAVGIKDRQLAANLAEYVVRQLEKQLKPDEIPRVEQVQDLVEKTLIKNGQASMAKAYILYRQKRTKIRRMKGLLGVVDELKLPLNAILVLERRYLKKDEKGKVIESTSQMFRRIARSLAEVERQYGKSDADVTKYENKFYRMMTNLEFIPNSPTLMNAGTMFRQLSACFVLPIEDSIESIFDTLKASAIIHKTGGGTGFSFSRLRPRGDVVRTTGGIASGAISFAKIYDTATEVMKQGGRRRGANMGILRVDHPEIMDFIVAKEKEGVLRNFNISVAVTDKFMNAVEKDGDFDLITPRSDETVEMLKARAIWNLMIMMAWKNGEPGVIFLDTINRHNQTPSLGQIESTNPCGEQPLLPYESCNLGSIDVSKFVANDGKMDWDRLRQTVRLAVRFLDNVVDANVYTLPEIEKMTKGNRKIGLGVMGFADTLIKMGIRYDTEEGLQTGEKLMKFITTEARKMSVELGEEKGSFPNFRGSVWEKQFKTMRNATVTTIAPTGTISIIAGCSQGIEPLFAIVYIREVAESLGRSLIEVNPLFESMALKEGFYGEELIKRIARKTSVQDVEEVPERVRRLFVVAHDISAEWHVRMQAAFQKYTDNAVSKTINFLNRATPDDIDKAYWLAYKLGCKGVTVYRYGSREKQVLRPVESEGTLADFSFGCPTCS